MNLSHKIYKKYVSDIVAPLMIKLGISANHVTVFNIVLMCGGATYLFATGHYVFAVSVCIVSAALDYIDGDIARRSGKVTQLGIWLDSASDIMVQNFIMGGIAISISFANKACIPLAIAFFVFNNAATVVALKYNARFGFDSYNGSALFRKYMATKPTALNSFLCAAIDPTVNFTALVAFTVRYWIIIGIFIGMDKIFVLVTLSLITRFIIMYSVYTLYLADYKKLWVVQALTILDETREEYYKARGVSNAV